MNGVFTPVSLNQSEQYYACWQRTPRRSLDYTLANLWGWQAYYGLEWMFADDFCWIRQTQPSNLYWAPLGDWNAIPWQKIFLEVKPEGRTFIRVPEELSLIWKEALGSRLQSDEDRGQWEYLYKQQDLADLPGNRYHKKKNHVRAFTKTYGTPDYRPLNENMVEDVLGLEDDWCQWHECEDSPSLRAENEAINRVLSHWQAFRGLTGGSLYVDDKIVAFSVGEDLGDGTLGVHYEKGLNGFKGVYQTMNSLFASHAAAGFTLVNRAQDLNEEGLRQAKMTYLPTDFLRKYTVIIH
ncbi:MAG: DUF2156 domain-containing protein [Desulfovibrio sp.]|nr:DUF2156 domain-containing protein [Desulfovibrio sp.]